MLLCKDRSRDKINDLLSILNRFKGSPDCYFRLSIPYISTDQAIHHLCAFHILFGIFNRPELILSLFKREHFLKLFLPYCIRTVYKSFGLLSHCIQFHQILCNHLHCLFYLALRLIPLRCSKFIQLWRFRICPGIFLDQIHLRCKNIKDSSVCIGNFHIISSNSIYFDFLNSLINSKSVILMYHIVSRFKFGKFLDFFSFISFSFLFFLFLTKNIRFRDDRKL